MQFDVLCNSLFFHLQFLNNSQIASPTPPPFFANMPINIHEFVAFRYNSTGTSATEKYDLASLNPLLNGLHSIDNLTQFT
jgi:hypothetical protein